MVAPLAFPWAPGTPPGPSAGLALGAGSSRGASQAGVKLSHQHKRQNFRQPELPLTAQGLEDRVL